MKKSTKAMSMKAAPPKPGHTKGQSKTNAAPPKKMAGKRGKSDSFNTWNWSE